LEQELAPQFLVLARLELVGVLVLEPLTFTEPTSSSLQ
jgi:hypothetical protein